jgi:hypothetical protein
MPRTISDQEYEHFVKQDQTAKFVESIWNDPEFSNDAKALVKRKYPNLPIEGYDLEQRVNSRFEQEKQEREQREREEREAEEDRKQKAARAKTQKEYGFTDDAMAELEQMMIDRNIGNYEDAAYLKAAKSPRASEPTFDSSRWHHEKADGFAEIAKDPEGWGRTQIMNAIRADQDRERTGR